MKEIFERLREKFDVRENGKDIDSTRENDSRSRPANRPAKDPLKLKEELLKRYEGSDLSRVFDFERRENELGQVLLMEKEVKEEFDLPRPKKEGEAGDPTEEILSDLKLLYGIGPVRENRLREEGYERISQLKEHPQWCEQAEKLLEELGDGGRERLTQLVLRWNGCGSPAALRLSCFFQRSDFAILDIETLGLSQRPIILLGIGLPQGKKLRVLQFLVGDPGQEPAALLEFLEAARERKALISFNGKRFDLPYIEGRLKFYGMTGNLEAWKNSHFDMLHFSRQAWQKELPNCKLATIEQRKLSLDREIDIPGSMVPDFYREYQDTGNPGPLVPIVEHNRQDIASLATIFKVVGEDLL